MRKYLYPQLPARIMALTLMCFIFTAAFTQEKETLNNSETISTTTSKHGLYTGLGYGSNMLLSGISISSAQPYLSFDLLYSYNQQWILSAVFYNLPGINPALAFYDLSAGYNRTFNSWLDAGISISSYSTAKELQEDYFGNFTYMTASAGLDWRILYSQFIYSAILNQEGNGYLQISNSHFFSTPDLFKGKAYFTFDPSVNMVLGDKYAKEDVVIQTGMGPNSTTETATVYSSSFGLLDMEFSLPIGFNFGKTTLELAPLYYLPIHNDPDFPAERGMFLFLNLYWKIL
jgi:hypothetical protein